MNKTRALLFAAVMLLSLHLAAQDTTSQAKSAVDAAVMAMGSAALQSVQYSGSGQFYATGQAYQPGGPWPRYTLKKYTMSLNFTAPAMRQQVVRIDDERPPAGAE